MLKQCAAQDDTWVDYWAEVARDAQRQQECLRATEERFAALLGRFLEETGAAWRVPRQADRQDPSQGYRNGSWGQLAPNPHPAPASITCGERPASPLSAARPPAFAPVGSGR